MRFTWLALPVFLVASNASLAFPAMYAATLDISPWVPKPEERVIVTVHDTVDGFLRGGIAVQRLQTNIDGKVITISATLADSASSPGPSTGFPVDLGYLLPGRYTVNYASDSTANPAFHHASLEFTVSSAGLATAVEFFNAALGHYFITAFPDEIAKLDQGIIVGWSRTGESFHVMLVETMPSTAMPVCRFYGLPAFGLNSHFFTSLPCECADVQRRWPDQWILETANAFGVVAVESYCPSGSRPLYRLYNNRPDANHRYTISSQTRDAMLAQGWILEGSGYNPMDNRFAMCVPN